jgi:hypothetical protein
VPKELLICNLDAPSPGFVTHLWLRQVLSVASSAFLFSQV